MLHVKLPENPLQGGKTLFLRLNIRARSDNKKVFVLIFTDVFAKSQQNTAGEWNSSDLVKN